MVFFFFSLTVCLFVCDIISDKLQLMKEEERKERVVVKREKEREDGEDEEN